MYRLFKAGLAAAAVIVSFAAFVVDAADVMVTTSASGVRPGDARTRPAESNIGVPHLSAGRVAPAGAQ